LLALQIARHDLLAVVAQGDVQPAGALESIVLSERDGGGGGRQASAVP
jgi:hypothetical protein